MRPLRGNRQEIRVSLLRLGVVVTDSSRGHGVPPELLSQQGKGRELLAVLGLPQGARQGQLDWQFITALGVVGNQGGNRVELEAGTLEGQESFRRLDQVVFDVGDRCPLAT